MKRCTNRFFLFISVLVTLFLTLTISSVAYSTDDVEDFDESVILSDSLPNNEEAFGRSTETNYLELLYTVESPMDPISPTVTITFDKTNIDSFVLNTIGLVVVDSFIDETVNTASYIITSPDGFGTLEVMAQANGVTVAQKTIYTYRNENSIYVSEASKDTAWHKYMQDLLDNEIITIDDWHSAYSEQSLSFSENDSECTFDDCSEITESLSDDMFLVRGKITWTTDQNNVLPMRFTKVELRKQGLLGSSYISSTFTDENGNYYFIIDSDELGNSLDSSVSVFIRTHTESKTFDVCYPLREDFNYFDSHLETISLSNPGIVNISRRLKRDEGYMPYRLAYIQQGMVVAQSLALDMGMVGYEDKKLYVFYLGDTAQILKDIGLEQIENTINSNEIAFCYDVISFIGYNYFNDFTTTIHEYGHYVENRMGNYGDAVKGQIFARIPEMFDGKFLSLSNFLPVVFNTIDDYVHDETDNHFTETSGKAFQMELTWSEAWATAFAEIAMQRYSSLYVGLSTDKYSFSPQYESKSMDNNSGEAQEKAVTVFLWDLYDGDPDPSDPPKYDDDNMNMSVEDWWALTTVPGTYTLQDLSSNILENYPELINDVGEIFSSTKISPALQDGIISPCVDGSLILRWYVNGGAPYLNDKFTVVFYYEDNIILRIDGIDEDDVVTTDLALFDYIVPTEHWLTVMEQYEDGQEIYAVVYGYRSGEFDSGPYFSRKVKVRSANSVHLFNDQDYDNTYHWDACACGVAASAKTKHDLSYSHTGSSSETHSISCNDCDYSSSANHQFTEYVKTSETYHRAICICGCERTQLHTGYSYGYSNSDSSNHYIYCACGHLVKTERHTMVLVVGRSKCRYCGYERTGSGQIIIKGKKKDEIDI